MVEKNCPKTARKALFIGGVASTPPQGLTLQNIARVSRVKMVLKVHNSHLLRQNISDRPRVPTKQILLSHPGTMYYINLDAVKFYWFIKARLKNLI